MQPRLSQEAELNFLNGMEDIDLGGTLGGNDILMLSPVKGGVEPSPVVARASVRCVRETGDDIVAPEEYQAVLESRFVELRKLYYHTKEQKLEALGTINELREAVKARDARIESLEGQLRALQKPGRRSSLTRLSTNTPHPTSPTKPPQAARRSTSASRSDSVTRSLQQENSLLKEKLKTLQDWAATIKPPPHAAMARVQ
eukprot:TRINITY_DN42475_c0_g1_i1.p1 TRINITY_DN42475_c0_g1~~TRINITY_DN42475_c0_g1_i1.p1  ORF type:complete len:215 (+),score=51.84 TRINITY_DN42475_c0_g1_i1:47-646(+)